VCAVRRHGWVQGSRVRGDMEVSAAIPQASDLIPVLFGCGCAACVLCLL